MVLAILRLLFQDFILHKTVYHLPLAHIARLLKPLLNLSTASVCVHPMVIIVRVP